MTPSESLAGRVYVDANILIYHLTAVPQFQTALDDLIRRIDSGLVEAYSSELTLAEILVRPLRAGDQAAAQAARALFSPESWLRVWPVDRLVIERAALIRSTRSVKLPDAVHAATAIEARCPIMLTNDLRLGGVEGLRFVSLGELGMPPA